MARSSQLLFCILPAKSTAYTLPHGAFRSGSGGEARLISGGSRAAFISSSSSPIPEAPHSSSSHLKPPIMVSKRVYNWYVSMVAALCMVLYGYDASVFNSVQGSDNFLEWINLGKDDTYMLGLSKFSRDW